MAKIIDAQGRERAAMIAAETVIVVDPLNGTNRKLFAGRPIPGGLEEAYQDAVGEAPAPAAAPTSQPEAEGVTATAAAVQKAIDLGVDLGDVHGTGKNGKITVGDVEDAAE